MSLQVNKNTWAREKVINPKVKLIKETIIEATVEQKREEAEEKRRKKKRIVYKAKEKMATDVEAKKSEDEQLVRNLLSSIDKAEKQNMETARSGRKTDETTNRPLLVSFNNEQDAFELNWNLPKMKDATTEIRSLKINPEWSLKKGVSTNDD